MRATFSDLDHKSAEKQVLQVCMSLKKGIDLQHAIDVVQQDSLDEIFDEVKQCIRSKGPEINVATLHVATLISSSGSSTMGNTITHILQSCRILLRQLILRTNIAKNSETPTLRNIPHPSSYLAWQMETWQRSNWQGGRFHHLRKLSQHAGLQKCPARMS